jgi:hypothetical protein
MGFNYRPRIRLGKYTTITKTGVSFRTGIPGLSYRHSFTSSNKPSATNPTPEAPKQSPSISNAIFNVFALSILCLLLMGIANAMEGKILACLVPLLFVSRIYRPLFLNYTYGLKSEGIYKSDRRYKTGSRYLGSRQVIDKDNKIYFTPEERTVARVEGAAKLMVVSSLILFYAFSKTAPQPVVSTPLAALQIKDLTVGSPISKIRRVEKRRPDQEYGGRQIFNNTKYAGDKGDIAYVVSAGKIEKIEFTEQGDNTAYARLLQRLTARYGPPQDSTILNTTWQNDSLAIRVFSFEDEATVTLERK